MNGVCLSRGRLVVRIHASVMVMAAYMIFSGHGDLLLAAYMSIIIHEAAHAAASSALGFPPQEIELTPMGAMLCLHDQTKIPPIRRTAILLAGPAMTLLLCFLAVGLTKTGWLHRDDGRLLFVCNAGILMMNMLPCLPLDGGSMFALLLGCFLNVKTCCVLMRIIGCACGLALIVIAFIAAYQGSGFNLSMVIIGCFLIHAAQAGTANAAMNELRMLMDRKIRFERRGIVSASAAAVMADVPLLQLMRSLPHNRFAAFIVLERGSLKPLGIISEDKLIAASLEHPAAAAGDLLADPTENTTVRRQKP